MNHSCCLAHSCLGASGSGRFQVGQMERPHGGSRCFAVVYAQLIKNNKRCHPRVAAIWGRIDNSFPCSLVSYFRAFFKKCHLVFRLKRNNQQFWRQERHGCQILSLVIWRWLFSWIRYFLKGGKKEKEEICITTVSCGKSCHLTDLPVCNWMKPVDLTLQRSITTAPQHTSFYIYAFSRRLYPKWLTRGGLAIKLHRGAITKDCCLVKWDFLTRVEMNAEGEGKYRSVLGQESGVIIMTLMNEEWSSRQAERFKCPSGCVTLGLRSVGSLCPALCARHSHPQIPVTLAKIII